MRMITTAGLRYRYDPKVHSNMSLFGANSMLVKC